MAKFRTNSQKKYAEHVKDIVARYSDDLARYDKLLIQYLKEASDKLAERLRRLHPEAQWSAWQYEHLRSDIKEIMAGFEKKFIGITEKAINQSVKDGISVTTQPLASGLNMSMYYGSPDVFVPAFRDEWTVRLLGIAKTRIKDAMGATEQRIMQEILVGMMSDAPRHQIINTIMDSLKGDIGGERAVAGFKGLNHRARTILRTESLKIHNLSTQMQGNFAYNQMGNQGDKMWLHGVFASGIGKKGGSKSVLKGKGGSKVRFYTPRPGHQALDGTKVPWNDTFVNPYTLTPLMYPHDPEAPAEEVINCGCAHYYVPPDEVLLPEDEIISLAV